jgi:hypothetical protein
MSFSSQKQERRKRVSAGSYYPESCAIKCVELRGDHTEEHFTTVKDRKKAG